MTDSIELLEVHTRTPEMAEWETLAINGGRFAASSSPVIVAESSTFTPIQWSRGALSSAVIRGADDLEVFFPDDLAESLELGEAFATARRTMETPWRFQIFEASIEDVHGQMVATRCERIAIVFPVSVDATPGGVRFVCRSARAELLGRRGPFRT